MPEGPEVAWLTKYIRDKVEGKTLTQIKILHGRYKNHGPPANFTSFTKSLPLKCTRVDKKGKVIFIHFDNDWCLISKLGMTGWWYMPGDEPTWHKPVSNIICEFGEQSLIFGDFRSYGTLTITREKSVMDREWNKLAPDITNKITTFDMIKERLDTKIFGTQSSKALMEDVLVDQQVIFSGVGNYLKSEILYDARISPLRMASDVSLEEWKRVFQVCRKITDRMMKAIDSKNDDAYFQAMKVYMKKKDPLGNPVQVHTTKAGRSTFWVPSMQY
jgi:DNA-formamidopyrimidine glycosylase